MSDDVEDLVGKLLPKLRSAVTDGLKSGPKLETYLDLDPLTDPQPYRVDVTWQTYSHEHCLGVGGVLYHASLEQCIPQSHGAIELALVWDVDVVDMRDNARKLLDGAKSFAERARDFERKTVLWMVAEKAIEGGSYGLDSVKWHVAEQGGSWRLIASGSDADAAKKEGVVEELVAPIGCLPAGVTAMLVRLRTGPTMRRVVDDLTLTVHRLSTEAVQLKLSERFFLEGDGAVRFV